MDKVPNKLRIIAGGPYELPDPPFETHYDDSEDPRLRELAARYELEALTRDAQNELEIFFRLQRIFLFAFEIGAQFMDEKNRIHSFC